MSELSDLEKLKKEVENLKGYLRGHNSVMYDISRMNLGNFRQMLAEYYSVLSETQEDLMEGINNDEYEEFLHELDIETNIHSVYPLRREIGLREREKKLMSQEDIPVKKGGKTRKNRKSKK